MTNTPYELLHVNAVVNAATHFFNNSCQIRDSRTCPPLQAIFVENSDYSEEVSINNNVHVQSELVKTLYFSADFQTNLPLILSFPLLSRAQPTRRSNDS